MRQRADIEIGGKHVLVPRWLIAIVVILILAAPAIWAVLQFRGSIEDYADETQAETLATSVAGCERNNGLRIAAFSNSVLDALTREAAADQYTDDAREAILTYAALNWRDAQEVIDASSEFPDPDWPETPEQAKLEKLARPGLTDPGPPTVDCKAAFSAAQAEATDAEAAVASGSSGD